MSVRGRKLRGKQVVKEEGGSDSDGQDDAAMDLQVNYHTS